MNKISLEDFVAYLPMHTYIFLPTREPWPGSSVNSQFPAVARLDDNGKPVLDKKGKPVKIPPSLWLDINRPVHQMTWAPGLQMLIRDKVVAEGGWIDKPDAICLNLYRPPRIERGNAGKAKPWLDHIRKIYPDDADHIVMWLAQRVQQPQDKLNHALVLGGAQGIGKDTLLVPVKYAVGEWNFVEVSPSHMLGRFNGFVKSVILRVSEARDLGDSNRFDFYDHLKTYTAAPPEVLRCDEKNLREHSVFNCCGVVITTNYKTDGIFLPADDRRHYVAWSDLTKEDFKQSYWKKLWGWYAKGGTGHVAAYLSKLDISAFDAKAPPPKTAAFWAIVDASRSPEESELADILDGLGNPDVVTLEQIMNSADANLSNWLEDRKNRRIIPHRMEKIGYAPVRNTDADSGLWRVPDDMSNGYSRPRNGPWNIATTRQVIYAKSTLPLRDQLRAVQDLLRKATAAAKEVMHKAQAGNGAARR